MPPAPRPPSTAVLEYFVPRETPVVSRLGTSARTPAQEAALGRGGGGIGDINITQFFRTSLSEIEIERRR